jgi:hypothetical protein
MAWFISLLFGWENWEQTEELGRMIDGHDLHDGLSVLFICDFLRISHNSDLFSCPGGLFDNIWHGAWRSFALAWPDSFALLLLRFRLFSVFIHRDV